MKYTLTLIFSIICFLSIAQETLEGTVLTNEDDQEIPLQGASVYWLGTQAGTTTKTVNLIWYFRSQPINW